MWYFFLLSYTYYSGWKKFSTLVCDHSIERYCVLCSLLFNITKIIIFNIYLVRQSCKRRMLLEFRASMADNILQSMVCSFTVIDLLKTDKGIIDLYLLEFKWTTKNIPDRQLSGWKEYLSSSQNRCFPICTLPINISSCSVKNCVQNLSLIV